MTLSSSRLKTLEAFALAEDRDAVVESLAVGTQEHTEFLYQHLQNKCGGNPTPELKALYNKVYELKNSLARQSGGHIRRTPLLIELELRQQLLEIGHDERMRKEFTKEWIQRKNIDFNYQCEADSRSSDHKEDELPSELDEKSIDTETLLIEHFKMAHGYPQIFEPCAHEWLSRQPSLDGDALEVFLRRLEEPTGNIVKLLARYFNHKDTKGSDFLRFEVCKKLTLDQLRQLPSGARSLSSYVDLYISKLSPPAHVDLKCDQVERRAYFDRVHKFTKTLNKAHVSTKACIMFHRLKFLADQNEYDVAAFIEYVKADRPFLSYDKLPYRRDRSKRDSSTVAHFHTEIKLDPRAGEFSAAWSDVELIEGYLAHFFRTGEKPSKFSKYFDGPWMEKLYAETMLLAGDVGKSEKHIRTIDNTSRIDLLRERIDIEFAKNNKKFYKPNDDVNIRVFLKNVPSLVVKVFEINTKAYYRIHSRPLATDINLDGLQAQHERTHDFSTRVKNGFERFEHTFALSELKGKTGIFVVDLIGNGVHARAILQIGDIRAVQRESVAGHVFTLLNENDEVIKSGEIIFNGATYKPANDHGHIYIPYRPASEKKEQTILLTDTDSGLTCMQEFVHMPEKYSFNCGFFCDRESLLEGAQATVVVRPELFVNERRAPIEGVLYDASLTISTTERRVGDSGGTESSKKVGDFHLSDTEVSTHTFTVPRDLRTVSFAVDAKVKTKSTQKVINLSADRSISINEVDDSNETFDYFFTKTKDMRYVISVLGKTGEPRVGAKISLRLKHKYLQATRMVEIKLQTDANGHVFLGELNDIEEVFVAQKSWKLSEDARKEDKVLNFKASEPITIPFMKLLDHQTRNVSEMIRLTDAQYTQDFTRTLSLHDNGFLEAKGLEEGDYIMVNKATSERIAISVAGDVGVDDCYAVSGDRVLQLTNPRQLQISSLDTDKICLANWTPDTRVHVAATHFAYNENSMFEQLISKDMYRTAPVERKFDKPESQFLTQRVISDEHRYVLERKSAKKFVGNMLERPSLLNNPWSHQKTKTTTKVAKKGEHLEKRAMGRRRPVGDSCMINPHDVNSTELAKASARSLSWANIEFLTSGAALLSNLKPDPNTGIVYLPKGTFSPHHHVITVLAMDADQAVQRTITSGHKLGSSMTTKEVGNTGDRTSRFKDIRLYPGLDPEKSIIQQRTVSLLQAGDSLTIEDHGAGTFETFACISEVLALYRTMSSKPDANLLTEFSFVADWPKLCDDTKLLKYDKYSCHELNFFLFHKDRPFFDKVVQPFLRCKTQKTFMDHYMLGDIENVYEYNEPFAYSTLNAVERILLASMLSDSETNGPSNTLRACDDIVSLMAFDETKEERLFKTALNAKSLESEETKRNVELEIALNESTTTSALSRGAQLPSTLAGSSTGYVKTLTGKTFALRFDPSDSVMVAKMKLTAQEGIPADQIRLIFNAQQLEDHRTLGEYGFEDGSTLHMVLRLRGGLTKEAKQQQQTKLQEKKYARQPQSMLSQRQQQQQQQQASFGGAAPLRQRAQAQQDKLQRTQKQRRLYQPPDEVREYEETQYFKIPWKDQTSYLIKMSRFWADYASHLLSPRSGSSEEKSPPFLSKHFVSAAHSFPEMMFALAVQGFPFSPVRDGDMRAVKLSREGSQLTVAALQPVAMFVQELLEVEPEHSTVMVNREYFDPSEPTHMVDGERVDKFVTGKFLRSRVYGSRVTLTNVSSAKQNLEALVQIPQGAIPVKGSSATRTRLVSLDRYSTKLIETHFYFPFGGSFRHFPVQVSKNQHHVGKCPPKILEVVSEADGDLDSWRYVSQEGSKDEVLAYLKKHNVRGIDLEAICWRLNDRDFFIATCEILRERHALRAPNAGAYKVLTFALRHGTLQELRELLSWPGFLPDYALKGQISRNCGALVQFNPFERKIAQHLEYAPLINARAHKLGKEREILNDKLKAQYELFLKQLCYKGTTGRETLSVKDRLEAVYYFLLQDRIDEAIDLFHSISIGAVADGDDSCADWQYDYLRAYLDFFSDNDGGPQEALDIAAKYRRYPIAKKRKLFVEIEKQLSDMKYKDEQVDHPDAAEVQRDVGDRDRLMDRAANAEASIEVAVESGKLMIDYNNATTVVVNFYEMDIELLFSTTPFMANGGAAFSMVSPSRVLRVELPSEEKAVWSDRQQGGPCVKAIEIPDDLKSRNVFIEVVAGGIVRTTTHYANDIRVQIMKNYGQLQVLQRSSKRLVRRAYVKVYSKMHDGTVQFLKDGYTDLRGKFDYVSVSTSQLAKTERLAILVLSDRVGAAVREATPPESAK